MKRIFVAIVIASSAIAASAQEATNPRHEGASFQTISVNGVGRVTLTPDRFSINVGVQTQALTVEDAVNENNTKVASVIAALKKAGATDQEIRTAGFSIYPQQDYTQGQAPRVVGYQVSNSVTVTKKQIAEAGKLLQAAISAGVNQVSGIQFEVSDQARGRDQGLRAAFEDARSQAAVLAAAAGRTLGRAITITAGTTPGASRPVPLAPRMAMEAKVSQVPVESGSQELICMVSAVFELQ
jgi:uncharacterized protein